MASFKKTNVKIYTKPGVKTTPDSIYWKKLGVPVLVKEFGPIDYIDFSPVDPHYFAVTCSVRVQVYNAITKQIYKNLSRFRETAYGGSFRSDGRLICAGGEEAHVKLFDVSSKSLLRVFKGHKSAVHRCFFTADKTHIASFSDDKTVCLWDIPSEKEIISFSDHVDYVRAGSVSPVSADIILSGGYDNTVCMYDTRTKLRVFQLDHGAPVESVIFLPSGGVFLSAGGTEIRVWDALAAGKLLAKMSQHHKTITCLKLCSENKRLLSSSLDRHVKIYDVATYQVVHSLDYPSAVLSFGVSAKDETVVAGMVDGLISISRRDDEPQPTRQERRKVSYRYAPDNVQPSSVDLVIHEKKPGQISNHDVHLKKFQYSKALDCVLKPFVLNKTPHVTVSVLQELMRRKALRSAIAGREGRALLIVLRFLVKYIGDYKFTRTLIDVTNIFMDVYEDVLDQDPEVSKMCSVLAEKLRKEEKLTKQLLEVQGALQLILSAANAGEQNMQTHKTTEKLYPSANAQINPVVNLA